MNEQWALFLVGLLVGIVGAGLVVYDFEQTRYLSLENSYQEAVNKAQNKVITETNASSIVNTKIGDEDANLLNNAINKFRTGGMSKPSSSRVPVVSKTSSGNNAVACTDRQVAKLKAQISLRDIQINELQKWIKQQAAIYH